MRRVIEREGVPATDQVVSVFEPHTNIIVKDWRDTQTAHKLNLTTSEHGMVLNVVIEKGNPVDNSRLLPMINRIQARHGKLPRQLPRMRVMPARKKTLRIKAVGLPKMRCMKIEKMTGSEWIYKKFKRFCAGIEGNVSMLKRVFGLDCCTWRGLEHFPSYVMSAALAHNFKLFVRLSQQDL